MIRLARIKSVIANQVANLPKQKFIYSILVIPLYFFSNLSFAQSLTLGTTANFVMFTSSGAVSNIGASTLTGNVGTGLGAISGFATSTLNTSFYNNDADAAQAKVDLLIAYIRLSAIPVTNTMHAPAFGNGESIPSGVYSIGGAGSIAGVLTLDGQGNIDAFFILKFEGALTAAVASRIILVNGARACNVFWIAEGAISVGASSTISGTLIANPGAVTLGAGDTLEGRMLSTDGALTFGPGLGAIPLEMTTIPIACVPDFGNPILGTVANFALFSSVGSVTYAANSGIIGDVGANVGTISGFPSSVLLGSSHTANDTTAQAVLDLQTAYTQLFNTTTTNASHLPAFGNGETLTAGVYAIAAAGSLAGTLVLNGQGNINATFIFKIDGAFTTAAQSKVILTNGASSGNIFWVVEGAVSMGTFSYMKGALIAHNGANTMGAKGNLEGQMLSTAGAVDISSGVVYRTNFCYNFSALPVELLSFAGECNNQNIALKWSTALEINNNYFSIERSNDGIAWHNVGSHGGAGNSTSIQHYSFTDVEQYNGLSYYRLKQTDFDGAFEYSEIIAITNCLEEIAELAVYPNPANGTLNLHFTGLESQILQTSVYNLLGELVYDSEFYTPKIGLGNKVAGVYFINLRLPLKNIMKRFVMAG